MPGGAAENQLLRPLRRRHPRLRLDSPAALGLLHDSLLLGHELTGAKLKEVAGVRVGVDGVSVVDSKRAGDARNAAHPDEAGFDQVTSGMVANGASTRVRPGRRGRRDLRRPAERQSGACGPFGIGSFLGHWVFLLRRT